MLFKSSLEEKNFLKALEQDMVKGTETKSKGILMSMSESLDQLYPQFFIKGVATCSIHIDCWGFVLSSVHCVERESISDLFGSFASG
eukprot:15358120-Ditylum_brightwellii.AAC.1